MPKGAVTLARVFLSTWGDNGNIGDSILRRGMLRTFHGIDGVRLHVHVGRKYMPIPNDDRYLSAVGLRGDEAVHNTPIGWLARYAASAMTNRTVMVMPAGEIVYPERTRFYFGWWTALCALLPLAHRGTAVQAGAGVRLSTVGKAASRGTRRVRKSVDVPAMERYARRKMAVVVWRDPGTSDSFGVGDVAPDWAFGEGPDPLAEGLGAPPCERKVLAVTTRWDRDALSANKIRLLREIADARGLRIQVFSQVRDDDEAMAKLARELHPGTEPLLFGSQSHAQCEDKIRALHRQSAIVASDRLHALIIGATEGAVPLAVSNWTIEKTVRTLKPGGFALPTDEPAAINAYLDEMLSDSASVTSRIAAARAELDRLRSRLRSFVDGRPVPQPSTVDQQSCDYRHAAAS